MSSFTDPLNVSPIDDDMNYWSLNTTFTYKIGDLDSNKKVVVPAGYITDFATIPWPVSMVLPKTGKYGKASVVHDYLCDTREILVDNKPVSITRKKADDIFLEAMGVLKVNPVVKYTMYAAVRLYAILKSK